MTIGSLAQLQLIKGLRVSHNLLDGCQLMLYDYTLIDTLENTVIEERRFMKKITNKPSLFKGQPTPLISDSVQEIKQAKEWSRVEIMFIILLVTLSIACLVIAFEQTNVYFSFSDESASIDGSLYRSLFDILYVSAIAMLLLILFVISYKCFLRYFQSIETIN